jgi:hypothetical protein
VRRAVHGPDGTTGAATPLEPNTSPHSFHQCRNGSRLAPVRSEPGAPSPGVHHTSEADMVVKITPNDKGNPPGKLADAELHFTDGPLEGLKLIGFGIWERRSAGSRNVTFPARQYSVNGERRSFALLRPAVDSTAQDRVRDLILQAYQEYESTAAVTG